MLKREDVQIVMVFPFRAWKRNYFNLLYDINVITWCSAWFWANEASTLNCTHFKLERVEVFRVEGLITVDNKVKRPTRDGHHIPYACLLQVKVCTLSVLRWTALVHVIMLWNKLWSSVEWWLAWELDWYWLKPFDLTQSLTMNWIRLFWLTLCLTMIWTGWNWASNHDLD